MHNTKHLFLTLLLAITPVFMKAQENDIKAGLRAGHNAVFGGFAAASLETTQTFCKDFSISGGIQYNTIGKTTLEARPAYKIEMARQMFFPNIQKIIGGVKYLVNSL